VADEMDLLLALVDERDRHGRRLVSEGEGVLTAPWSLAAIALWHQNLVAGTERLGELVPLAGASCKEWGALAPL
jgi:hypothetical protein